MSNIDSKKDFIIQYSDVYKSFGEKKIYEKFNLKVFPGETLTVLGESGTGKSVMIKMLIGLLSPDQGNIFFRDEDVVAMTEKERIELRQQISMVFQLAALFDSLTVFENIAYPLRVHLTLSEKEVVEKVHQQLNLINLPLEIGGKYPGELSGGVQKMIGLARSTIMKPEVILYDEPTTGLDPESTTLINKLIRKIQHERNATSIVITHDMGGAFYFSDRIAFLHHHRIHQIGTVSSIRDSKDRTLQRFLKGIPDKM